VPTLFDGPGVAPATMCLECGAEFVDRAGFDAAVARAAAALRDAGAGAGQIVAWLGLNSIEMLAQFFACQQIGAVWMPMNWRLARPELRAQLEHAGAAHLVHDAAWANTATALRVDAALARGATTGMADDDVLLVYTSGTTGEPRGALHTRAAMAANIAAAIDAQAFDARTRTLAVLPMFHVGGLCIQVLPTLAVGGAVRLQPRFDADAWFDDVALWRPTTSLLVPATMRALVEHSRWSDADLSSLRFVNSGSSIVPPPLIEAFHARGVPVAQVYGATETGPVTLVLRPDEAMAQVGSVGRPALGVQVRLDGPMTDEGEVLVRAPNLARGYHRRPHDDAFAGGWFRTGDLARRRADGGYEIVGRAKELIISGGENIHPHEIEQVALADPAVAEAAVVALPDARWGEVAVLAIVLRPGREYDDARLRALFDARLARFKHPRRVLVLESLPKTALGKVRKDTLAASLRG
jgi:fatty-acyl-CoA synthase